MTHWIITYDKKQFDIYRCLKEIGTTDWSQLRNKFQVGDIVYMYCSKPVMSITHKMRIVRINIPKEEKNDESPYLSPDYVDKGEPYIRLEPISARKSYLLRRDELIKHGLNPTAARSRQYVEGELLDYIESVYQK